VVLLNINSDTGAIACGEMHLKDQGGSWSDGKWYKTFDLVLKTSHTGVTGSTSRSTTQPATQPEPMPRNCSKPNTPTGRLKELKKLFDLGLINKSDYDKKER
jgi:hypothetical protein